MTGPGENACQRRGVSCGACCGIYNLTLGEDDRSRLIRDRTAEFANVDLTQAGSFASYRQAREAVEAGIPRFNAETYVCPFFGIPRGRDSAGCMVHPSITGNPHSQNFSFYGASICQTYDCPNKERDVNLVYSDYCSRFPEYARLMADTRFFNLLISLPGFLQTLAAALDGDPAERADWLSRLDALANARLLAPESQAVASFEFRRFTNDEEELLDVFGHLNQFDRVRMLDTFRSLG
ncbi:MAG: hypothetical protein JNM27_19185 [Leptospirales bacterium]|nr:hypothetical protein [Leptospirales bacterium]